MKASERRDLGEIASENESKQREARALELRIGHADTHVEKCQDSGELKLRPCKVTLLRNLERWLSALRHRRLLLVRSGAGRLKRGKSALAFKNEPHRRPTIDVSTRVDIATFFNSISHSIRSRWSVNSPNSATRRRWS
jgi:hypothetical protein